MLRVERIARDIDAALGPRREASRVPRSTTRPSPSLLTRPSVAAAGPFSSARTSLFASAGAQPIIPTHRRQSSKGASKLTPLNPPLALLIGSLPGNCSAWLLSLHSDKPLTSTPLGGLRHSFPKGQGDFSRSPFSLFNTRSRGSSTGTSNSRSCESIHSFFLLRPWDNQLHSFS